VCILAVLPTWGVKKFPLSRSSSASYTQLLLLHVSFSFFFFMVPILTWGCPQVKIEVPRSYQMLSGWSVLPRMSVAGFCHSVEVFLPSGVAKG
ncbi:hypothetical protein PIB30_097262, partial [Stylosanthes scabra]|nr:hypothetical protein [Stylosanthes scabra]